MKFVTLFLLFLLSGSLAAQERVRLDLKTKLFEKPGMTAVKNGTLLILNESDWASVVEWNEDYALWMRNPRRSVVGDSVELTIDIELREPSLLEEGDLISARTVTFCYSTRGDWKREGAAGAVRTIDDVERYIGYAIALADIAVPAKMALVRHLLATLDEVMPVDTEEMKMEAMVTGTGVATVARKMIDERR